MATSVIATTTSTGVTLSSDDYILLDGVTHYSDAFSATIDASASAGYQHNIQIYGTLISVLDNAIEDTGVATGHGFDVYVGQSGTIMADAFAVTGYDDYMTITNHGVIDGQILATGNHATLVNHGTYNLSDNQTAVNFSGGGVSTVVNTGTMTSNNQLIRFDGAASHQIHFTNSGEITTNGWAIYVSTGNHTAQVTNSGTITATQGGAAFTSFSSGSTDFDNTGTIYGHIDMDQTLSGQDLVSNSGTIHGDIQTGAGNDQITNYGEMHGFIAGGAGDDDYRIYGTFVELVENVGEGWDKVRTDISHWLEENFEELELEGAEHIDGFGNELDNVIAGNSGNNQIRGRQGDDLASGLDGDDLIQGGRGEDTLYGENGDDHVYGGTENDELFGGDGADFLDGRRDDDRIFGGRGEDTLYGANGDDRLGGGTGDDILMGGTGSDKMTGGSGADTFIWRRTADSTDTANADEITDFEVGIDLLDFDRAMQGAFDINIAGAFTAGGIASIITLETGGNTEVYADIDGNGTADMRVDLTGTLGLTEIDFIL